MASRIQLCRDAADLDNVTSPEAQGWVKITDTRPANLRFLVDQALALVTEDMRDRLAPVLSELSPGSPWTTVLTKRLGRADGRADPMAEFDFSAYNRLLRYLMPEPDRDALWAAFAPAASRSSVITALRNVWSTRNELSHPTAPMSMDSCRTHLARIQWFAETAALASHPAIQQMLAWLGDLKTGASPKSITVAEVADLEARLREVTQLLADAGAALEAKDAEMEDATSRAREAEAAASKAEADAAQAAAEREALRKQVREHTAAKEAEEARFAAQIAAATERTQHEQLAALRKLQDAEHLQAAAQRTQAEMVARIEMLTAELAQTRAHAAVRTNVHSDIQERLRSLQQRAAGALNPTPIARQAGEPSSRRVGQTWTGPRGEDVWTISIDGLMFRRRDGAPLERLIGFEEGRRTVRRFMEIRTTGGRVWVDDDGYATTYVDGKLIYLGNLASEEPAPVDVPTVGTPLGEFPGRRYDIRGHRVQDKATRAHLATFVGESTASAVAARLLKARPDGGTFRVNRNGTVATWKDGDWTYAGHVSPAEWFPGHLDHAAG